ncbi:hypothetical protein FACS189427_12670 [Planctomycetales bacterium]|nr:hypothetical protein FACS189427_12670 [Planctomycetales bacterium]
MSIQSFIFQYIASQITQSIKNEVLKSRPQKQTVRSEERKESQLTCENVETQQKSDENTVDAGFIFAMPMESTGITDFFHNRKVYKAANRKFTTGRLGKLDTVFNAVSVVSGIGRNNAAEATESLINAFHPKRIVSAGYSGGLSKRLKPLTVCFPEAVKSAQTGGIIDISGHFPEWFLDEESAKGKLTLLTADSAVMFPAAKLKLYKETGAELVDMETFAVAEVCLRRNVPFLSIRIILDTADEEFPKDIQQIAKAAETGTIRLAGSLFGTLVKRPSIVTDLYSLKQRTFAASEKLAKYTIRELSR